MIGAVEPTMKLQFVEEALMHIKNEVLSLGSFVIKDGTNVRFWDDTWIREKPLKIQYPNLYNIAREPHATISKIMATSTSSKYLLQEGSSG
jgi:hypothetical protein